jgi:hypothetical protein
MYEIHVDIGFHIWYSMVWKKMLDKQRIPGYDDDRNGYTEDIFSVLL